MEFLNEIELNLIFDSLAKINYLGLTDISGDIYTLAAASMLHIGYMDVTKEQRQDAKKKIFMGIYGLSEGAS